MCQWTAFCLAVLLVSAPGCVSRPDWTMPKLPNVATRLNPLQRFTGPREESAADQLRSLAEQVPRMETQQQEELVRQLDVRFASERNPYVRGEIVHVLRNVNVPDATELLRRALQDDSPEVRIAACEVLAEQTVPEAIDLLAETLRADEDVDVRLAATRGLGGFQDPSAVEALRVAVNDNDPAMQYRGVQSLRASSPVDLGNRLSVWKRFTKPTAPANIEAPALLAAEPRELH